MEEFSKFADVLANAVVVDARSDNDYDNGEEDGADGDNGGEDWVLAAVCGARTDRVGDWRGAKKLRD